MSWTIKGASLRELDSDEIFMGRDVMEYLEGVVYDLDKIYHAMPMDIEKPQENKELIFDLIRRMEFAADQFSIRPEELRTQIVEK